MSDEKLSKADLEKQAKEKAIAKEMLPFLFYAAFPILLTVLIAFTFGPFNR